MDTAERVAQLKILNKEIRSCEKCPLHKTRTQGVPGEGPADADILFIGEAPGQNEDLQGIPFIGAAGKFLVELLASIGLTREQVFIANVLKSRPPGNRDPLPEEAAACWPFLERQVAIIDPKLVILLGRHSMDRFLPGLKISQAHGRPKRRLVSGLGTRVYLPIYHPAAALYNGSLRQTLFDDFAKIPAILKKIEDLPAFQDPMKKMHTEPPEPTLGL